MATLRRSGLSPRLSAICGIAVARMVESRFSMKNPQATTSGISRRSRGSAAVRYCGGEAGSARSSVMPSDRSGGPAAGRQGTSLSW